jgi:hypothetical protein
MAMAECRRCGADVDREELEENGGACNDCWDEHEENRMRGRDDDDNEDDEDEW